MEPINNQLRLPNAPLGFRPTPSGGRVAYGDNPLGSFLAEWGPDGALIRHRCSSQPAPQAAKSACPTCGPQTPDPGSAPSGAPSRVAKKPSRLLPPGTWLSGLIATATVGLVRPCTSCQSRAAAMNRAGWRGLPKLWAAWAIARTRSSLTSIFKRRSGRRGVTTTALQERTRHALPR